MQVGTMSFGVIPKEQFTELSRVKLFRPLLLPLGDQPPAFGGDGQGLAVDFIVIGFGLVNRQDPAFGGPNPRFGTIERAIGTEDQLIPILIDPGVKPMDLSRNRLALALGVPRRINEIVPGKRGISADTALRLARRCGMSSQFWMGLQMDYEVG